MGARETKEGREVEGGFQDLLKLQSHQQRRQWPKKDQELRVVKVKWRKKVEGRRAHLLRVNLGARKETNIYLTDSEKKYIVDFAKDHESVQRHGQEGLPVGEVCKQS